MLEIEDEVLDRPLSADGWTFSCCESVSEDEKTADIEIEDEVLDRPLSADGFYTICCTMGIVPGDEIAPTRRMSGNEAASADGDHMVTVMLQAGGVFGTGASTH